MTPTEIINPQKPEKVSTISLLESLSENGMRQDFAKRLMETEIENRQFDFEWRLARTFADSGEFDLVKGKTPEQAIASAMAKIQMGKYWGINPADSMRFIRFDRGKPVLENEIIAAKLQEAGWEWDLDFSENDNGRCSGCYMYPKRKDSKGNFNPLLDRDGKQVVVKFTEKEASEAMVYEKEKWIRLIDKWNFKSWPEDMYYTKTIARFKRRYAPGVLAGTRTPDEIGEQYEPPADVSTQTTAMDNPFKAVQRPALESGAEPITITPSKQQEKQEVPVEKSANGISEVPKPVLVDPSRGKGPRSHAKAESNPAPAIPPTKETHEPDDRSDWLPENLGGTPTQAQRREGPMPAPSQRDRIVSIGTELARLGNRNPKAIQACVQQWIMAFANLTTYKLAPQEAYNIPLDFLEPEAKREGLAILQDPHGMGLKAGAGWNELIRYIDKYGPEFKAACKKAAVAHLSDNPAMLTDLIEAAQEEGPIPEGDLVALLSIYTIAPALTTKFQAHAAELGTSMQELFAALPGQTEAGILTLLAGGKNSADGKQPELWQE